MRALLLIALLAACRPDIGYSTYSCGPEAACPDGQSCDEQSDECVEIHTGSLFACTTEDREPDNTPATATPIPGITCASSLTPLASCLEGGDALDMFTFTTPAACAAIQLAVVLSFPVSYEELKITLAGSDGSTVDATDAVCDQSSFDSIETRCLTAPLATSTTYVLRIEPTGSGDCAGSCAYNRYELSVETTPP